MSTYAYTYLCIYIFMYEHTYEIHITNLYITNIYDIFNHRFSVRELWSRSMLLEKEKKIFPKNQLKWEVERGTVIQIGILFVFCQIIFSLD